jgi:hypothetical protein
MGFFAPSLLTSERGGWRGGGWDVAATDSIRDPTFLHFSGRGQRDAHPVVSATKVDRFARSAISQRWICSGTSCMAASMLELLDQLIIRHQQRTSG